MSDKIFLVAGGTGGHLFPAIATSENDPKNRTRAPYGEERILRKCTLKIGPVPLVGKNGFSENAP